MSLVDREYLKKELPAIPVKRMACPIPVRGIGSTIHKCEEFAVIDLYIPGKDGQTAKITREVHLVNNLKAKLLIRVDIMGPEGIVADIPRRVAVIHSCERLEINLSVSPRSNQRTQVSVASLAEASIPLFSTQAISVRIQGNAAALPTDQDVLFEPRHSLEGISVFTHVVDYAMSDIMV